MDFFIFGASFTSSHTLTQFGIEVHLSTFALTKLVVVTPYYLLVNETEVSMHLASLVGANICDCQGWSLLCFLRTQHSLLVSEVTGAPIEVPSGQVQAEMLTRCYVY